MALIVFALTFAVMALMPARAAANDDPVNAVPLQIGVVDGTTNTMNFAQPAEDNQACTDGGRQVILNYTAWYRFVGTGKPMTVSTRGSTFDTVAILRDVNGQTIGPCDDDRARPGDDTSEFAFNSSPGVTYLLQVGTCVIFSPLQYCSNPPRQVGQIFVAVYEPPANDARGQPLDLTAVGSATIPSTRGALGGELGESLTCVQTGQSINYDKTVWFAYNAPTAGRLTLTASGYDTVIAAYQGQSAAPVGCHRGFPGESRLTFDVAPGQYLLQVGGAGVAFSAADDGRLTVGASFQDRNDIDGDSDGFTPRQNDCNDSNRLINPIAFDDPNNLVNEDCRNGPAKHKPIPTQIVGLFSRTGRMDLWVRTLPAKSTVRLRCIGRSCPAQLRQRVRRPTKAKNRLDLLKNTRLPAGSVIELRVTNRLYIGRGKTWRIRRNLRPVTREFLIRPPVRR